MFNGLMWLQLSIDLTQFKKTVIKNSGQTGP